MNTTMPLCWMRKLGAACQPRGYLLRYEVFSKTLSKNEAINGNAYHLVEVEELRLTSMIHTRKASAIMTIGRDNHSLDRL